MIKVWDFHYWHMHEHGADYEDPSAVLRAYHFNMDYLIELDRIGFEGAFFTEHHFCKPARRHPIC